MKIKFATWNIDTNLTKTEEGWAKESHPQWRVENRMPSILAKITNINADLLNLQEMRQTRNKYGELIDTITPIRVYLNSFGYDVLVQSYNQTRSRAALYITTYKKDKFKLINHKCKYLTKTPDTLTYRPDLEDKNSDEIRHINHDVKDNNFGEFFERSIFITHLQHIQTKEELINFNVHLAMKLEHRLQATKLISEFVYQEHQNKPLAKIIIAGDFNSFPNLQGHEQMDIIKKAVMHDKTYLTEISNNLYLPNDDPINSSFIYYPFDYGPSDMIFKEQIVSLPKLAPQMRKQEIANIFKNEECKALGDKIDHIFAHGLEKVGKTILAVTPQFGNGPKSYNEQDLKAYILKYYNHGPAFASDHQPIVVELES